MGEARRIFGHALLDHDAVFFDEHVLCIAGLENDAFERGEARHEREVHGIDGIVQRREGVEHRSAEVLFECEEE